MRNPFYALLVVACVALLVTMFVYLVGWFYVPHPDEPPPALPLPPWMKWIDRNALWLITAEVAGIIVLSSLTISLDRFFDPASSLKSGASSSGNKSSSSAAVETNS